MSLAEIHNPRAAAELIDKFRKRFSTKVCMAPQRDHEGAIVSAHTLSLQSMLRKVAVDAHVYTIGQAKHMGCDTFPIEVHRRGIRDVTVFNGFCQKHDKELFSCLDDEPFRFERKQLFMLAFRAVARECYLKRKQYESLPSADEFAAIHGITGKVELSQAAVIYQAASLRGAEDIEALKASFDKYLVSQSWDRVITRAILFPTTPTVLATTAFQPFIDMDGNQLQDFEDLNADMSQICMSVIPTEDGGAAIFSWLDSSNSAPRRFFESVINTVDLTSSTLHAIFDNTENFVMNPIWYENFSEQHKAYIFSRIMRFSKNESYIEAPRPEEMAPKLANWGSAVVANF